MRRLALLALAVAVLAAAGSLPACGPQFKLPTEHRENRTIPGAGTYQMIKTRQNLDGIQDILLTPSGELFLVRQNLLAHTGSVEAWPPGLSDKLATVFPGVVNPTAICFGANHLFVLDQGDTAAARIDLSPNTVPYASDCGLIAGFSRPIADVSRYWTVREFELDGTPIGSFTDTTLSWVYGIAGDASGRVYVSGTLMYCNVDPFDARIKTLTNRPRIYRYQPGAAPGSVIGNWSRDHTWEVGEGTGIGAGNDPRGMQWSDATGPALFFADRKNNEVQKYADPATGSSSFKIDIDLGAPDADSLQFFQPLDVAVDSAGYVYALDAGNKRVLRFSPEGKFEQRVDLQPDENLHRLSTPVAVAADNQQVYVADPAYGEVLRFRRRQ